MQDGSDEELDLCVYVSACVCVCVCARTSVYMCACARMRKINSSNEEKASAREKLGQNWRQIAKTRRRRHDVVELYVPDLIMTPRPT